MPSELIPTGSPTFLFTDIEGSTALVQELGDRWPATLEAHRRLLRQAWVDHGGVEMGTEGDSFFVAFGDAPDAVSAARAAQLALAARAPWPEGRPVRVRMGLHTGEVEVVGTDYVGLSVHVAARVSSSAHGGQVLLSDATRERVQDVEVIDHGEHRLKDIRRPVRLFQLVDPALPATFPALRTLTTSPNNLPAPIDDFVGRVSELSAIHAAVGAHRLVTMSGPGGSGKTRLALEVAAARAPTLPDGAWFVDLSVTHDPDGVEAVVARVLGVRGDVDRTLRLSLVEALRGQESLLLLDNCEHVLEPVASLVADLLAAAPKVRILATSRERLDVRGEQVFPVPPLTVPRADADDEPCDAVTLFVARVRAVSPAFDPDPRASRVVASICRRLDGLPLAIELAAARLRAISLEVLAERLDDRFRILVGPGREGGRQTLEAVVAWSYDLLTDVEQALFCRLSVFPDSFDLPTAEAVCAGDPIDDLDVVDLLTSLVDKSLVSTVLLDDGALRYQLLETLRAFGSARLAEQGGTEAWRDSLERWAVGRVEELESVMRTPAQDEALRRVRPDHANIQAVLDRALLQGDTTTALRIVDAVPVGVPSQRLELIGDLIGRLGGKASTTIGEALLTSANLELERARHDRGVDAARRAEQVFTELGDDAKATWARFFQIHPSWALGDADRVDALCERLLVEFRALGSPLGIAYVSWIASLRVDDAGYASELAAAACDEFRAIGADFGLAHALEGRALVLVRAGEPHAAIPFAAESLELFVRSGNAGCTAHSLEAAAACLAQVGDLVDVAELSGAAEGFRERTGHGHRSWELRGYEETLRALGDGNPELEAARVRGRAHSLTSAAGRAAELLADAQQ